MASARFFANAAEKVVDNVVLPAAAVAGAAFYNMLTHDKKEPEVKDHRESKDVKYLPNLDEKESHSHTFSI